MKIKEISNISFISLHFICRLSFVKLSKKMKNYVILLKESVLHKKKKGMKYSLESIKLDTVTPFHSIVECRS